MGLGAGKPSKMIKKFDKKDEESGTRGAPDAHPQEQGSPFPRPQPPAPGTGRSGGGLPEAPPPAPGPPLGPRAPGPGCRLERLAAPPRRVPAPRPNPSQPALRGALSGGWARKCARMSRWPGVAGGVRPPGRAPLVFGAGVDRARVACLWTLKGLDSPVPRG